MKNFTTLFVLLLCSLLGYSQRIYSVYPEAARRGEQVSFDIEGYATHFTGSSSFIVSFKSNVDGSEFSSTGFSAIGVNYLLGSMTIPENATPGLYSVSIKTFNEGRLTLSNAFTISNRPPLPKFIRHTPKSGSNGQQVDMTITVRNAAFMSTSNLDVEMVGIDNGTRISATSIVPINDSTITAIINIPAHNLSDFCHLYITTDYDSIYGTPYSFTLYGDDAHIVSVSPNMASDGDHVDITILGSETFFTDTVSGSFNVKLEKNPLDYLNATSVTIVNDSVLIASFDIPLHARACENDVIVYRPGYSLTVDNAFTINGTNPELEIITPSEVEQGATRDIIISGVALYLNDSSSYDIAFYGDQGGDLLPVSPPVVLNDNQIKVTITVPAGAILGFYDMYMSNEMEYFYFENAIKVMDDGNPNPKLASITPNVAERGQSMDVTIIGTNSHFTQTSDLKVTLGGNNYYWPSSVTVISDTELKCHFDFPGDAFAGIYNLYVVDNPTQNYLYLEKVFTINGSASDPSLVTIGPAMTYPGQVFDITIKGVNTHFMASGSNLDMAIYSPATYVQPISFEATNNTTIIAHFEIPNDFPLGVYDFGLMSDIDGYLQLRRFAIANAVGLDEQEEVISNLYPNPVHDKLYIETRYPTLSISIFDINGKQTVVNLQSIEQNNLLLVVPIENLGLSPGMYFIKLQTETGFEYRKFVVE